MCVGRHGGIWEAIESRGNVQQGLRECCGTQKGAWGGRGQVEPTHTVPKEQVERVSRGA